MSILDIAIIVVFVGAIIYGLYKGVIAQLGSLGGILLGVLACRFFGADLARAIGGILPDMSSDASTTAYIDTIVANVIIFLVVYVLSIVLSRFLRKITHALCLGVFDRIVGAVFSMFKWFLVFSIVLNIWLVFDADAGFEKKSKLGGGVAIRAIVQLAPSAFGVADDVIQKHTKQNNK